MNEYINFNNQLVEKSAPIFSISNRAFNYGDGCFESMRITGGEIPFLQHHIDRLVKTIAVLEMDTPSILNFEALKTAINELCAKNVVGEEGRVRLNLFRNDGGLYTPDNDNVSFVLDVTPYTIAKGFELNSKGLKVDLYSNIKKPCNVLSSIKTCNSLLYVLAGKYKRDNYFDEAVILNDKHNVCEFISSNLFIVINGVLYTPALTEGCIAGVMRNIIIDLAAKARINVYETELKPNDLIRADEIFMTNAVQGIQWVGGYKTKRYFNKLSKTLSDALNEAVVIQKQQIEG